jgi:hypothetical protein
MKSSDAQVRSVTRWGHGAMASVSLAALATVMGLATPARGFFPQRYVACHEEDANAVVVITAPSPPAQAPPGPTLLPLVRRRAPKRLTIAPLVVIDVARAEPLPAREAHPVAPPARDEGRRLAPPMVLAEGRNNYRCIGIPRGSAGIGRVLSAPPGTRFFGRISAASWRRDNMRAAGAFALGKAAPALRRELERPILPGLEGYQLAEQLQLKLAAGLALADLEDRAAAPALRAFVQSRELQPYPLIWEDALDPLARLDPVLAQRYAIAALTRLVNQPAAMGKHRGMVRQLLPLLTQSSPRALAVLRQLSSLLVEPDGDPDGHEACLVLGARARLGDELLLAELRPELAVELRTQRGVACYSQLIGPVFPGRDPDEVATLTHRHRYQEILALLRLMADRERSGQGDPRFATARAQLRAWLVKRSGEPDVRGDASHRDNNPERRALHLSALAFLGDARAQRQLEALIRDPADDGTAPWLAAHQALLFELPGAADWAAARLAIAMGSITRRFTQRSWGSRGLVKVTEHVEVIDALARRSDPRFALGLLDRNVFAREATVHHLARLRPPRACEIVGQAARHAQPQSVQDAFWALSVLGDECRDTMGRLANDLGQTPAVQGMALEALAMMRDPRVPALLDRSATARELKPATERARIIDSARE